MIKPAQDSKGAVDVTGPADGGRLIVLTAPLTETIDHAGYFIQMALASMPMRMEAVINQKYPEWREVERDSDGSARYMPAGVRLVEASLLREFPAEDVVCCVPDDISRFIGPRTRVVGVSTHNPLGVTFAAGVYASVRSRLRLKGGDLQRASALAFDQISPTCARSTSCNPSSPRSALPENASPHSVTQFCSEAGIPAMLRYILQADSCQTILCGSADVEELRKEVGRILGASKDAAAGSFRYADPKLFRCHAYHAILVVSFT
jgi:hypothetical protein